MATSWHSSWWPVGYSLESDIFHLNNHLIVHFGTLTVLLILQSKHFSQLLCRYSKEIKVKSDFQFGMYYRFCYGAHCKIWGQAPSDKIGKVENY
jgi:hypothetical protein